MPAQQLLRAMRIPPPDGSRDLRIEDPSNRWLVHLAGRMLLPLALRLRLSANSISLAGLALGTGAAWSYLHWRSPGFATLGFLLTICWLIADGLDGMVARATGSASALGRFLDGLCDHGVFLLVYLALGASLNSPAYWIIGTIAGIVHGIQSSLYEGERARFQRRVKGDPGSGPATPPVNAMMRLYDTVAGSIDRLGAPFDRLIATTADPQALARDYAVRAARPLRLMVLLTGNMRVLLIYLACLAGDPRIYWWIELVPLTAVTAAGLLWHRRVEAGLVRGASG